jgi:5-(carboxyamino)imidazole ribonucleotide synthase
MAELRRAAPPLRIGILGGGQLARMLVLEAYSLGYEPLVLCPSKSEPAAQVCKMHVEGDPHLSKDLEAFFKKADVVTFESEFYDAKLLGILASDSKKSTLPPPLAMGLIQDRLTQKTVLSDLQIPTAAFIHNFKPGDLFLRFQNGFVLKKRRGGYDGNGTFVIKSQAELLKYHSQILTEGESLIAEELIPFERELAIMIARSKAGEFFHLPLVETHQVDGRCDWVKGPINHQQCSSLLAKLKTLLDHINYVGVMGVELFERNGELLVNELAPRVHNSGHYSQSACSMNQFRLHLQLIAGEEPIAKIYSSPAFAMANLIGSSSAIPELSNNLVSSLHWYGKTENRAGRKMGHLNHVGQNTDVVLTEVLADRKKIQI